MPYGIVMLFALLAVMRCVPLTCQRYTSRPEGTSLAKQASRSAGAEHIAQKRLFCLIDKRGASAGGQGGIRTHGTVAGTPDFECCKSLADSRIEQVIAGSLVNCRKPRRRNGLRTFRPVSARGNLNQPRVQIKSRSCVKCRRSCAFARSQARKYMPCQRR